MYLHTWFVLEEFLFYGPNIKHYSFKLGKTFEQLLTHWVGHHFQYYILVKPHFAHIYLAQPHLFYIFIQYMFVFVFLCLFFFSCQRQISIALRPYSFS